MGSRDTIVKFGYIVLFAYVGLMTTKNINSYALQIGNNEYNAMTYLYLTLWQKEETHEMVPQKFILIAWILENKECCQQVEKYRFKNICG